MIFEYDLVLKTRLRREVSHVSGKEQDKQETVGHKDNDKKRNEEGQQTAAPSGSGFQFELLD